MKHRWKFYPSNSAFGNDPSDPVTVCDECGTELNDANQDEECEEEEKVMWEYLEPKDGPVFEGLEDEEVVYAEHQAQYIPLRTLRGSGKNVAVISRWSPTEEVRKLVAEGADIYLELWTFGNALSPIRMMVSDGKLDPDWVRICLLDRAAKAAAEC